MFKKILASLAAPVFAMVFSLAAHSQAAPVSDTPDTTITVAAASDLKFALEDIAKNYEKSTGQKLRLVFGSSGNFYTQIMQGAPFDIYMSADENYVLKLAEAGKTLPAQDKGKIYAQGRIGIWVPNGSKLQADPELRDLAAALKDGRLQKFAIANPSHAPYGARAKEALQFAGLWQSIEPKLVLGENISQAAQFASSGSTEGGIIAQSLAIAPPMQGKGSFALIPENWHKPLLQRMAMLQNPNSNANKGASDQANPAAKAFYDYLSSASAQKILARFGFVLPTK